MMFSDPLFSKEDHIWVFGGGDGGVSLGEDRGWKDNRMRHMTKVDCARKEWFGLDTGDMRPH